MSKTIKFPYLHVLDERIAELQAIYFHVEIISIRDNVCVVHIA